MPQAVSSVNPAHNPAASAGASPPAETTAVVHENLEGWVADVSSPQLLRDAVEKAFNYRGDVTIRRRDGSSVVGYLFDRSIIDTDPARSLIRMLLELSGGESRREVIMLADITGIEFTGKDTAAGKSFQTWLKKYQEKKAAGEKNIGIEPDPL